MKRNRNLAQISRKSNARQSSLRNRRLASSNARNRKGYPKFHAWDTVVVFSLLALLIGFIGYKSKLVEKAESKMTVYAQEYQQEASRSATLQAENDALKARLDWSAKIVTTDTQKAVSRYYIQKYFGSEAGVAEKVFTCESNLNPNALNDRNKDGSVDRGVAQINSVHAKQFEQVTGLPYSWGAHDTKSNIQFAKWLYDHSGFSPWVCSQIVGVK